MEWFFLVLAILLENAGTVSMKLSHGFRNVLPSVMIAVFYIPSFFFLTLALRRIDVSVAYAVWSGLGTFCIALIGFLVFHEKLTAMRMVSMLLIIGGVVGLNLSGAGGAVRG
jgi:small multidrug resistance pump